MTELSPELSKKISAAVERMPAFPKSVQKILQLTQDLNCSAKEVVQIIETDPVMTVKILRVLNSAYYSLPSKITGINQSVVFLGFNTIKNLALSIASVGILPKNNIAGFDMQKYLLHSLTTAGIAKSLAAKVPDAAAMDCYIAGLLHDFGKVVFAQHLPEQFKLAIELSQREQIPLFAAEAQIIGVDHTVVGSFLVEKWQFPQALTDCIRQHHSNNAGETGMGACVFAANQICNKIYPENANDLQSDIFPDSVAQQFGCDLDALIATFGETGLEKIAAEARLFAQLDTSP